MNAERLRVIFAEEEILRKTGVLAQVVFEAIGLDPIPVPDQEKTRLALNKMNELLDQFDRLGGWKKMKLSKLPAQDRALLEYLPWALAGRMVMLATEAISKGYGSENDRCVRMFEFVAEKLGINSNPRESAEIFVECGGEVFDTLEKNNGIDIEMLVTEVRLINEALFPALSA